MQINDWAGRRLSRIAAKTTSFEEFDINNDAPDINFDAEQQFSKNGDGFLLPVVTVFLLLSFLPCPISPH